MGEGGSGQRPTAYYIESWYLDDDVPCGAASCCAVLKSRSLKCTAWASVGNWAHTQHGQREYHVQMGPLVLGFVLGFKLGAWLTAAWSYTGTRVLGPSAMD